MKKLACVMLFLLATASFNKMYAMKNIEIELRYEVIDVQSLSQELLQKLQFLSTKRIVDVYFDTASNDLLRKGVYIRIRNGKKIDIKFNRDCLYDPNLARQDHCEEYSFKLPLQAEDLSKLNEVCAVFNFAPIAHADLELFKQTHQLADSYSLDKTRTSYTDGEFIIAVDEIANLGTFLEIELMAPDVSKLEAVKERMRHFLDGLPLRPLKSGCLTLMLRKTNFEKYLQSRFVLEEDKKYRKEHAR